MERTADVLGNLHSAECSYCRFIKMCRSFIVVYGSSAFTEKKLCQDCESSGRHQADIGDMNLSNAMDEDNDDFDKIHLDLSE